MLCGWFKALLAATIPHSGNLCQSISCCICANELYFMLCCSTWSCYLELRQFVSVRQSISCCIWDVAPLHTVQMSSILCYVLYSEKFLRGRNFRDQTPARENLFPQKFGLTKICPSINFLLMSQAQCLWAAGSVNRQKVDLFCHRSINQTAEIFHDPQSTCCNCE